MKIKALSLRQPFASLIDCGLKTIETRKWSTPYRGPLLICSSKGRPYTGTGYDLGDEVPLGTALCVVDLFDIRPMRYEDQSAACCRVYDRAKSWLLRDRRAIPHFSVKGCLYLFDVEIDETWMVPK